MAKIGRWLLLGFLVSTIALKGIPAFFNLQKNKKEKERLENYLNKVVEIIQKEHKSFWGDTLDYNEAYSFAKDSYKASQKYNIPHELLLALAAHETGFENMITDRDLKNISWGYYAINEINHEWLEKLLRKEDSMYLNNKTNNKIIKHRLLLNPEIQHRYAALFIRDWMRRKKIKNPDSSIYVIKNWNSDKNHNENVKKKFYNIRNYIRSIIDERNESNENKK
ncbi:MAG: hypothetical protein N3G19_00815 [Candidatus Pacearchaeota archaeon]|nr:hypothetical protein [Candidatus Pacearchaeota archaeon]